MAETETNPLQRPLPDGVVPEEEIARTEDHWLVIMLGILAVMMGVMVVTGVTNALHSPSNVETIDPATFPRAAATEGLSHSRVWPQLQAT